MPLAETDRPIILERLYNAEQLGHLLRRLVPNCIPALSCLSSVIGYLRFQAAQKELGCEIKIAPHAKKNEQNNCPPLPAGGGSKSVGKLKKVLIYLSMRGKVKEMDGAERI